MKIAIVPGAFFPNPGGAQVQAHNLANKICEKKHNAEMVLLDKTTIKKKKYKITFFNKIIINIIFLLHYYLNIDLTFLLKIYLKKFIKKNKYHIWHFIFLNYKSLLIINILKKLNQKIIVTFQGADIQINKKINYGNRLDSKYEKLLQINKKNIDYFTAISKNIYNDLLNLKIPKNKIIEIPNGTILSKAKQIKKQVKKNKVNKLKIITVARYASKKKGFDLVEKILKILFEKKINFTWTIIGKNTSKILKTINDKKYINSLKIIEDLTNENELYYPNSKILKHYSKSDIYLNLSRIESFGITFIESLSCNLPIITFDRKGANEIVKNLNNGFVIKNKNFISFIKYLNKFYKDKNFFKNRPYLSSRKYDLDQLIYIYIKTYNNLSTKNKLEP